MRMKVRLEAFKVIGEVKLVSEAVLLQSLSKKALGNKKGKDTLDVCKKVDKFSLSTAAGVFVHGIEDEYYEVRSSACNSLGKLSVLSAQFAGTALNLLMDMLNDDIDVVRLQTLQTLYQMTTYDRLAMQEKFLHMFFGLLADISPLIRRSARKVIQHMKLSNITMFKSTIDYLIENLETYPEEEEDILFVLASIGMNHRKFCAKFATEFAEEIVSSSKGELNLDSSTVAAKIVLSVSSSIGKGMCMLGLSEALCSHAVLFIGKISHALRGTIDRDSLLSYLCSQCGLPFSVSSLKCIEAEETRNSSKLALVSSQTECMKGTCDLNGMLTFNNRCQDKDDLLKEDVVQDIRMTLKRVGDAWPLIKSHRISGAQWLLRACSEALKIISKDDNASENAFLEFSLLYTEVIELVAEVWDKIMLCNSFYNGMMVEDLLLRRLDMHLKKIRYCFKGLQIEEEQQILELTLLCDLLKVSTVENCTSVTLKKLLSTISRIEFLCMEKSPSLSHFAKEIKSACLVEPKSEVWGPSSVRKLVDLFHLEQIPFSGRFIQKKAIVQSLGNDSENPLPFIPGLPVGIPFCITLYNVSNEDRLWLIMAVGESVQYVFLDILQFGGLDNMRSFKSSITFYHTPRASSFTLKTSLGVECQLQDFSRLKIYGGGPGDDIVFICEEKIVYLVNVENR